MTRLEVSSRPELRAADDAAIEDAVAYADPMVLRGLIYQLTGDPEVEGIGVRPVASGFVEGLSRNRAQKPGSESETLNYTRSTHPIIADTQACRENSDSYFDSWELT